MLLQNRVRSAQRSGAISCGAAAVVSQWRIFRFMHSEMQMSVLMRVLRAPPVIPCRARELSQVSSQRIKAQEVSKATFP